jgi:alcohol dehydrogenase class IV
MISPLASISHFQVATDVYFGRGSLARLSPPSGRVLLLKSASLSGKIVEDLIARWSRGGTNAIVVEKPAGEPFSDQVDAVFAGLPRDLVAVAGIGGGSLLDFAKALAILAATGGGIADYEFGKRKLERALPLYLAPTTCGSGSEVTPYSVLNNSKTGRKFTLNHPALRAVQAAVDPEMLRSLPGSVLLSTALDAFTHCMEALLTRTDPRLIRPIAEAGLTIGWRGLPRAVKTQPSLELLEDLAQLSLSGGISIAHSRTGLIHTMSVAFAEFCDLPHGLLNARLLPYALAHNLPGYGGQLKALVERCSGERVTSDKAAYERVSAWVASLIGSAPPASGVEIYTRLDSIVRRMLQDTGLPGVSHGVIDAQSLTSLVKRVADASG